MRSGRKVELVGARVSIITGGELDDDEWGEFKRLGLARGWDSDARACLVEPEVLDEDEVVDALRRMGFDLSEIEQ